MSGQDGGLTLEGLAQRLGTLERENEALRNEVAGLRASGTPRLTEQAHELDGQVSRRQLIRNAGAAAVAAVAAGTLLNAREARADHFAPGIEVDYVFAHSNSRSAVAGVSSGPNGQFGVYGRAERPGFASVYGQNTTINGIGVRGQSLDGIGVKGTGAAGVQGESSTARRGAVEGSMDNASGYGVWGNSWGIGVRGTSGNNPGVKGESSASGMGAVEGHNGGTGGIGVQGIGAAGVQGVSETAGRGAVEGSQENASGYGVWGNSAGIGLRGSGGTHGGQFDGGKAQLRLVPKGTAGPPTTGSHAKGEIYMDSAGALFVCTAGGTPGTWRRVTTTAT
jgi:hypothetical protein